MRANSPDDFVRGIVEGAQEFGGEFVAFGGSCEQLVGLRGPNRLGLTKVSE